MEIKTKKILIIFADYELSSCGEDSWQEGLMGDCLNWNRLERSNKCLQKSFQWPNPNLLDLTPCFSSQLNEQTWDAALHCFLGCCLCFLPLAMQHLSLQT